MKNDGFDSVPEMVLAYTQAIIYVTVSRLNNFFKRYR